MKFLETVLKQSLEQIERRREPRTFADREVIVQMVTEEYRTGSATALDWSPNGLRVRHSLPLKSGQRVKVITPDWVLPMRVVWVGNIDGTLEAGLALEPPRHSINRPGQSDIVN
jgi:hypothetical protein